MISANGLAKISEGKYIDCTIAITKGKAGGLQDDYTMKSKLGLLTLDQILPLHLTGQNHALDVELYLSTPAQYLEIIVDTISN